MIGIDFVQKSVENEIEANFESGENCFSCNFHRLQKNNFESYRVISGIVSLKGLSWYTKMMF